MSTMEVDDILAEWNATPDNMAGDSVWSNEFYSISYRTTGKGYVGMFRFLGMTPHGHLGKSQWQVVSQRTVTRSGWTTSIGTWLSRQPEYRHKESFATVKEAKQAAIRAAFEHDTQSNNGEGFWVPS